MRVIAKKCPKWKTLQAVLSQVALSRYWWKNGMTKLQWDRDHEAVCTCNCAFLPMTFNLSLLLPHVVTPGREIWNVTVEPNSNYANISWKHNFPASSSEFVLEFTLDSKNLTESRPESPSLKLTSAKGSVGGTLLVLSVSLKCPNQQQTRVWAKCGRVYN